MILNKINNCTLLTRHFFAMNKFIVMSCEIWTFGKKLNYFGKFINSKKCILTSLLKKFSCLSTDFTQNKSFRVFDILNLCKRNSMSKNLEWFLMELQNYLLRNRILVVKLKRIINKVLMCWKTNMYLPFFKSST